MKKIIILFALFTALLVSSAYAEETSEKPWVFEIYDIDGTVASCDVFKNDMGELMFPVRFMMEALGAKVTWIPESGDVMLDFGGEKWLMKEHVLINQQISPEQSGNVFGYSDISGTSICFYMSNTHTLNLINSRYYVNEGSLELLARHFRCEMEKDENERCMKIFILPKPFYVGNMYRETKIKVDNGNGNIKEALALTDTDTLAAISFKDFFSAIGGIILEDYEDEYIESEKTDKYLEGYASELYQGVNFKNNVILCSYEKDAYFTFRFENGDFKGVFLYKIINATKETEETIFYVEQQPKEIRTNGRGLTGIAYMFNGEIYIDIRYAKNLLRFCGYELIENDNETYIKKVSDELDESLYFEAYKY